jgi:hypothetical protein
MGPRSKSVVNPLPALTLLTIARTRRARGAMQARAMRTARISASIAASALSIALVVACSRGAPSEPVAATTPTPATTPAPPPPPAPPPEPRPLAPDATSLSAEDRDYLVRQGLLEPEAELIADLRAHPELIACKGELGGTPGFHDPEAISILGRDRVHAAFDDGHSQGSLDLAFTVRGGKIKWHVDDTDCGNQARVANAGKP